jgi:polyribonucleotide nucleotidyltransferase
LEETWETMVSRLLINQRTLLLVKKVPDVEVVVEEEAVEAKVEITENLEKKELLEKIVVLRPVTNVKKKATSLETAKTLLLKDLDVEVEPREVVPMVEAVELELRDTEMLNTTLPEKETTKVTIKLMELAAEDVETAKVVPVKETGERLKKVKTLRKNLPLKLKVRLKPLLKRPNKLSLLLKKNLRKKKSASLMMNS